MEHQQAGANRLHVLNDVGGQEHQPALRRPGEEVAEVDALLRIQPHRGLVQDQEGRVAQQGLGDANPLALPAGQGADSGRRLLLQADLPDYLPDGGAWRAQALQGRHVVQELRHGELVKQAEVLGQVAQLGLQPPLRPLQGLPVHLDGAGGGQQAGHQQLHQGGLARPVWAQQAHQAGGAQV